MTDVTAILLNYQRPTNVARILASLHAQSLQPSVMVINNGPVVPDVGDAKLVNIPWNARCFVRHLFALYASTEWIAIMDDDLMPAKDTFLDEALRAASARPNAITGAYGCYLGKQAPYYDYMRPAKGDVEIIKGRLMIYRRALLAKVRFGLMPMQFGQRGDDIFISLETGRGEPIHWADEGIKQSLVDLPEGNCGLERDPKHYSYREAFCEYYVTNLLGR